MILFYIDESGAPDPIKPLDDADRTGLFCLCAIAVYAQRWHTFDKTIVRKKLELVQDIYARTGRTLELADCEIKSSWIRIPDQRSKRPFIKDLSDIQLTELVDLYYDQLVSCKMNLLYVVADKRHLPGLSRAQILNRAWSRLLDQIERLMRLKHPKHQALIINDDISPQRNRDLAMQHSKMMLDGTHNGTWLKHICEMPMFVKSELSVGVQMADLCSYNMLRVMRNNSLDYDHFQKIRPAIWTKRKMHKGVQSPFHGVWIEGPQSPLLKLLPSI